MARIRARVKTHYGGLRPIARWDVVPYQRFASTFKAGVVAFSKDGIQKVEFIINSGLASETTATATSMTYNDRSDVWEYWTEIDGSNYPDGNVTLDATVTGKDSGTNVLDQITIRNNDGGSLVAPEIWVDSSTGNDSTGTVGNSSLPCLTIEGAAITIESWMSSNGHGNVVDGGIIYLNQGDHNWGASTGSVIEANDEWLTVTLAVGGDKTNTRIVSYNETNVKKIKVKGVYCWYDKTNFSGPSAQPGIFLRPGWPDYRYWKLWLDDIEASAGNRYDTGAYVSQRYADGDDLLAPLYITDSYFHDMRILCYGATLLRGLTIERFGDDALHGAGIVVNCTADEIGGVHADSTPITFTAPDTITRTDGGSWITAGFTVGESVQIRSSGLNDSESSRYIKTVTASTIVTEEQTIVDDTAAYCTVASAVWHADAWQYWAHSPRNLIVYGYRATNLYYQGVMADGGSDSLDGCAFVNFEVFKAETLGDYWSTMSSFLWQLNVDHFLIWNCTFGRAGSSTANAYVYFLDKDAYRTLTNLSFRNSVTNVPTEFATSKILTGAVIDNNHFYSLSGPAADIDTNTTTGDAILDANGVPDIGSPAIDRVTGTALIPIDASATPVLRTSPSDAGAFEH